MNYATVYANEKHIIPDQKRLKKEFSNFKNILKEAGLGLEIIPFPEELNQIEDLHHDAVFIRDSGIMFKKYWIKARFSAKVRQKEADVYAPIIAKKFNKEIIEIPEDAYLELGEVFYLETKNASYYFGGISRSNEKGHNFVKEIIKPDHYIIIKAKGYHLDTVFSPVLSKDNEIIAFVLCKDLISQESIDKLKEFGLEMIYVDKIDSSGVDEELGNYAVNTLVAPGVMLNCSEFMTEGVEDKLKDLGIKRYVSPLTDFRYSGGSYHCLTNEVYEN